eukprot:4049172-Pleurochrysis_carterae.AAC.1
MVSDVSLHALGCYALYVARISQRAGRWRQAAAEGRVSAALHRRGERSRSSPHSRSGGRDLSSTVGHTQSAT